MESSFFNQNNNNINFIESHIGGNLDDNPENFVNQQKIINDSIDEYLRSLNYYNKLDRTKNENDNFDELYYASKHLTTHRINNAPTFVGDINYSNPIIFPDHYDPYFEYLYKKNLGSINTIVSKKKTIVNIDSSNRNKITTNNIQHYITLNNNSMAFTNNTNTFKIYLTDANKHFVVNDKIIIRGFQHYTLSFKSINLFFTNEQSYVILDLKPNFDFILPYYDIILSINNVTNNGSNQFKNIPLNLINQTHNVTLFTYNNDIRLKFDIPIRFYTNNELDQTLSSECTITFYNLGNFPISLINANYPLDQFNLTGYQIISSVASDYIEIKLNSILSINQNIILQGYWNNNVFYTGGNTIQIGKVLSINNGFLTPTKYTIPLNKSINNVACLKIISSEMPNVKKNINSPLEINSTIPNNKFYWDNLLDSTTYSIEIDTGFYTLDSLTTLMQNLISKVPRNVVNPNINLSLFNNMTIVGDPYSNTISFSSFNVYYLPKCLVSINELSPPVSSSSDLFVIKIYQLNHNLNVGDQIYINNSTNFLYIHDYDINRSDGFKIYEVLNNDYYTILLTNVNIIPDYDVTNNNGGFAITIKTPNSFRLRFDYSDTFGNLIGFNYTGSSVAITPYSNLQNNYTITNKQPYTYDINKILVYNNTVNISNTFNDFNLHSFRYMLLQCENFNLCSNPNSVSYFYKFQLTDDNNAIVLNKFVDAPVYLNPPIRTLSELNFNFVDPNGNDYNFFNLDHSFTLEITSLDNFPENTFINTSTSRL